MASREKPLEKEMAIFVKAHLGKNVFAPFTGTDYRAWNAWCHLLRLYGVSEDPRAISAMRETLRCAQRKEWIWEVFVQTIPGALDWGYVKRMWPKIVEGMMPHELPRDLSYHVAAEESDLPAEFQVASRLAAVMSFAAVETGEGGQVYRRHGLGWS